MSRGEGVPIECLESGARHSPAGSSNQWTGSYPGHGRSEFWSRTILVRPPLQADRRSDPRGISNAFQSIPHTPRTVLHGCHSGGAETVSKGQDPEEGEKEKRI